MGGAYEDERLRRESNQYYTLAMSALRQVQAWNARDRMEEILATIMIMTVYEVCLTLTVHNNPHIASTLISPPSFTIVPKDAAERGRSIYKAHAGFWSRLVRNPNSCL